MKSKANIWHKENIVKSAESNGSFSAIYKMKLSFMQNTSNRSKKLKRANFNMS